MPDYEIILAEQKPMDIYRRVRAALIISGKEFQMMRRDGIDLPSNYFHRLAISGRRPSLKWLKSVSDYCCINLMWLCHGRGDMFTGEINELSQNLLGRGAIMLDKQTVDYEAILSKQAAFDVYKRIKMALLWRDIPFAALHSKIGIGHYEIVSNARKGLKPDLRSLEKISILCQINLLWLIHGRGDMFVDNEIIKVESGKFIKRENGNTFTSFTADSIREYLKPDVLETRPPANFSFADEDDRQPHHEKDVLQAAQELKQAIDSLIEKFANGKTYESLYKDTITAFVKAKYDAKKSDSKFIAWLNRRLARFDLMIVSASEYANMHGQLHVLSHTMRDLFAHTGKASSPPPLAELVEARHGASPAGRPPLTGGRGKTPKLFGWR